MRMILVALRTKLFPRNEEIPLYYTYTKIQLLFLIGDTNSILGDVGDGGIRS